MEKDFEIAKLFEIYSPLLTKKRRELLEMYFSLDLSLGEISEMTGLSRQAANDGIKKGKAFLIETEEKLGFSKKIAKITAILDEFEKKSALAENIKDILGE